VVSSDQWKALPMDAGTIARINEIAKMGKPFPKKLVMYYGGKEVGDSNDNERESMFYDRNYRGRVVVDNGSEMPTGSEIRQFDHSTEEMKIVRADDTVVEVNGTVRQLEETAEGVVETDDGIGGVTDDQSWGENHDEMRGEQPRTGVRFDETNIEETSKGKYHYPILEDSSRTNPVGAPWFLSGKPVDASAAGGRPKRVTKQPERYGFEALVSEECLSEVVNISVLKSRKNLAFRVPFRPNGGRTRVQHARVEKLRAKHESAYILAVDRAIEQFGAKAVDSLEKELSGLEQKGVFEQVKYYTLSPEQRKRVIRSKMFLKEKFFPDGSFDKLKSRLVAGGDMQLREDYDERETSSPTVNLSSVYMVLSVAGKERRKVGTADVGMAYLNAGIAKDVFMKIDGRLAQMLVKLFPEKYELDKDGRIYVKLKKALYGCIESAKLWFDEISKALKGMGFVCNPHDQCVFNIDRNGHQVTVCLYVDDLLITSVDGDDIDWVAGELRKKYGTVTLNVGKVHSYLGQTFDMSVDGKVSVSMEGYIRDILDSQGVTGYRATPATTALYSINPDLELLPTADQDAFHSVVMRLMFLAQRARPDVLTPVAFLSRRWGKVTSEDKEKLERVLMYLNACPDLKMTLSCDDELRVYCYVDASFAVHTDMRSHTGAVVSLGGGAVHVSSKKQGLMTKSSTEAELVGLSDQVPQAIWTRNFLIAQGYAMGPARMYQDNQSTIALAEKGKSTSARTRHVAIRYFFVKDRIESGEIEIEYLPTEVMRADIMTKPLQGELFREMRARLMGMPERGAETGDEGGNKPLDA
jgi:Reverse transcriptase (RNA-dependent DNA polymerase)